MQQFETVPQVLGQEQFHGGQNLSGAQAEFGIFSAALGPAARALAQEPRANADQGFDPQLFGEVDNLAKFLEFLDHHDDFFAQLGSQQRDANEAEIFVTVADDQAAQLALQRQAREQLRLAADLQSEVQWLARIQDLFDDLPELVHFDREHAAVAALVIELGDRIAKRDVDGLHPVTQDVLKPDQHRKLQPARLGFLDHISQVHRGAAVLQWPGND